MSVKFRWKEFSRYPVSRLRFSRLRFDFRETNVVETRRLSRYMSANLWITHLRIRMWWDSIGRMLITKYTTILLRSTNQHIIRWDLNSRSYLSAYMYSTCIHMIHHTKQLEKRLKFALNFLDFLRIRIFLALRNSRTIFLDAFQRVRPRL